VLTAAAESDCSELHWRREILEKKVVVAAAAAAVTAALVSVALFPNVLLGKHRLKNMSEHIMSV
jgi:hypothetical protein